MGAFGFELKQAVRRVFTWKQTGAILIPAIGLALATIMFAVGWSYSSLSLPYKDADRLVVIGYVTVTPDNLKDPYMEATRPDPIPRLQDDDAQLFFDWRERKDVFTDIAAMRSRQQGQGGPLTAGTPNGDVRLILSDATANFFDVLGVSFPGIQAWKASAYLQYPLPVALTYKTGVKDFNRPEIGREFQTNYGSLVVNGVLPANFVHPTGGITERSFVPFVPGRGDSTGNLTVIGRLAPGITPQMAVQMLSAASGGEKAPEDEFMRNSGYTERLTARPVMDIIYKSSQSIVWGAWALGALTLLLCTANLAGLLLVRCVYRLREYALRSALGARFSDLLRIMLTELLFLSFIAAIIAAYITRVAMPAIAERIPVKSAAFGQPAFDLTAVVFLVMAALFVAAASGFFAAVALAGNYYKGFSQGIFAVFHSHRLTRIILTASQAAIAAVLICLSWMVVRGYLDIYFRHPGVDTGARIVEVNTYDFNSGTRKPGWVEFALDTIEAMRGGDQNTQIGFLSGSVLDGSASFTILRSPDGEYHEVNPMNTSPGLLRMQKNGIVAGRDFTEQDRRDVILINESFARKMGWRDEEALGKQFQQDELKTVIGVVRDFPTIARDSEVFPMVFMPFQRDDAYTMGFNLTFVIHQEAKARAGNIEKAIRTFDPEAVITRNATWGEMLGGTIRGRTFATFCVTLFTIAAIAIVVTGIVSTVTFITERRTRDIAIQIAIGAPPSRVCWFVVKDMVIAGVSGALAGGIASWWAGKAVAHYVYNGEKYQNLTGLAIAAAIMLAIIATSALLPALRALRVEPGSILNKE